MGSPAELTAGLREFGRRHRALITVLGSLATAAILVLLLAGRRHEFADALSDAAAWVLAVTVLLQIVALLARSEAWHLTIEAAGGTVDRRVLSFRSVPASARRRRCSSSAATAWLRRRPPGC